ncbi:SDR family NAD(P)-dependent oxidoreductase [Primorskyibacter flagellatus]|uniref:NAD(P)-dependent dehydrogenase, short-chain alcohol dehydrogenase family n=1 Tax=Primorskyibacter flagellatus TaxID=1387277 RepID=A0A1W1Z8Y0_9RHOB|nr:SDR family oxidoreductase [Primorskyibacter flagellatus]SMC44816.1 NAD(P)-dependent dehydrogenase, short-chain alcohol dehydrogenase family [Primorskyibacter flagellatus]
MSDWETRFSLAGRTALVTGASSGIGFAIAEVFADAGADIIGHGRDRDRLSELGRIVSARGRKFTAVTGDLACADETAGIAKAALAGAAGHIDILVNSAGIAVTGPVTTYAIEDWARTMAVNLTAPFVLSQALLPGMMTRGSGKIINISSQTGVIALQDHAAYATSKGGLNALTKSLMVEAAPHNVQVNAICPTVVMTEMGKQLWSAPEKKDPFIARTPLGRFGEPVEIADMALYLASPASDLVNGAIMMIEGGHSSI